jgi:CHAD domain-containing protein
MAVETATESERKYETPKAFALPDLAGLNGVGGIERVGAARIHDLSATYFDTEDLRLARNRMTMRRRTGGTDAGWHLKTPAAQDDRTEHRLPLGDGEAVPDDLLDLVRAIVRGRPLRPVARLRTRRHEYPLHDAAGRVLALVVDDRVQSEADGREQRWREVEVELDEGGPEVLAALDERLRAAGAEPSGSPSKLARALGDRLDPARVAAPDAPGSAKAVRAVVDYLRAQRDAIIENDPGVRRGEADPVHDMRVATRRLRSTLRTFRGRLWDRERTEALRGELSWLADRLGGVRDRQVMAERLHKAVGAEPPELIVGPVDERIGSHLDGDLQQGRRELDEALSDTRYYDLLDELDSLIDTPPDHSVRGRWVRRKAARALRRADRMMDEAVAVADSEPGDDAAEHEHERDERMHAARRAYKRARYAVEVFVPGKGARVRRLVKRLKELQDILGDHQDSVITRDVLREYGDRAQAAGESPFSYGILYARQQAAGDAALEALPGALKAARRRKLRRWLP